MKLPKKKWSQDIEYQGEEKNGKRDGFGFLFLLKKNHYYEGEFKNDMGDGKGIYSYSDGEKYEGEYKDGVKNGKGFYY